MRQPQAMQLEGVVIHMANHREADRIVEVMTPGVGRLRLRAPAARRSRRRFGGGLDLFSRLRLALHRGGAHAPGALPLLDAIEVVDPHAGLRDSLEALAVAGLLCQLVRAQVPLEAADVGCRPIYATLAAALAAAAAGRWPQALAALPRLATHMGIMPPLACPTCGGEAGPWGAGPCLLAHPTCQPGLAPCPAGVAQVLAGQAVPTSPQGAGALLATMQVLLADSLPRGPGGAVNLGALLWGQATAGVERE